MLCRSMPGSYPRPRRLIPQTHHNPHSPKSNSETSKAKHQTTKKADTAARSKTLAPLRQHDSCRVPRVKPRRSDQRTARSQPVTARTPCTQVQYFHLAWYLVPRGSVTFLLLPAPPSRVFHTKGFFLTNPAWGRLSGKGATNPGRARLYEETYL